MKWPGANRKVRTLRQLNYYFSHPMKRTNWFKFWNFSHSKLDFVGKRVSGVFLEPRSLVNQLDQFYDLFKTFGFDDIFIDQIFKQFFYYICAVSLNNLMLRQELCMWKTGMRIRYNISVLEDWARKMKMVWKNNIRKEFYSEIFLIVCSTFLTEQRNNITTNTDGTSIRFITIKKNRRRCSKHCRIMFNIVDRSGDENFEILSPGWLWRFNKTSIHWKINCQIKWTANGKFDLFPMTIKKMSLTSKLLFLHRYSGIKRCVHHGRIAGTSIYCCIQARWNTFRRNRTSRHFKLKSNPNKNLKSKNKSKNENKNNIYSIFCDFFFPFSSNFVFLQRVFFLLRWVEDKSE